MPHLSLAHPPEDCLATAAASPLRAAKASPAAKGAVKLLPSARPIPHAFECGKSFVVIHSNLPNSKLVTAFLSGSCCLFLYTPYSRSALCFSSDASAALHARYYQAFLPNQHWHIQSLPINMRQHWLHFLTSEVFEKRRYRLFPPPPSLPLFTGIRAWWWSHAHIGNLALDNSSALMSNGGSGHLIQGGPPRFYTGNGSIPNAVWEMSY